MENIHRRVFDTSFALWSERASLIQTRRRLMRYTYGDQWGDTVADFDGSAIIESDLIRKTGRRPITNNLIRRLVKTIVGRYRDMAARNEWYDKDTDSFDSLALTEELDSRLLEEFLISGMAIQRIADDNPFQKNKPYVINVSPDAFFCNHFSDPRGYDIETVGMLHDMSPAEIFLRFSKNNLKAAKEIERILTSDDCLPSSFAPSARSFFNSVKGRFRVIEVWSRQYDNAGNIVWRVRWFAPNGTLLDTYISPWKHASHPFALKFYPLTNGEVHSFVEDVVDQQRYINRIIVLIDRILATSAKGVLLFPKSQKADDMSWNDIARRWAAPDGIIPLTGKGTVLPQQIRRTSGDISAYRLLEMELKLFDQTAGVGSALLGSSNNSGGTGIEHYKAQVENATIALADIFRTFRALIDARNVKLANLRS